MQTQPLDTLFRSLDNAGYNYAITYEDNNWLLFISKRGGTSLYEIRARSVRQLRIDAKKVINDSTR